MSAPVKNTCPDIDSVISSIDEALKNCARARKDISREDLKLSDADDYFWNIEYCLGGLGKQLEQLRQDNSALRDWGHKLDDELFEASQTISELTEKLENKDPQ